MSIDIREFEISKTDFSLVPVRTYDWRTTKRIPGRYEVASCLYAGYQGGNGYRGELGAYRTFRVDKMSMESPEGNPFAYDERTGEDLTLPNFSFRLPTDCLVALVLFVVKRDGVVVNKNGYWMKSESVTPLNLEGCRTAIWKAAQRLGFSIDNPRAVRTMTLDVAKGGTVVREGPVNSWTREIERTTDPSDIDKWLWKSRRVMIDGSNIASKLDPTGTTLRNIRLLLQKLRKHGLEPSTFVDATLRHKGVDERELDQMIADGTIIQVPAGTSADDSFLADAKKLGAAVLSGDLFKPYAKTNPWITEFGRLYAAQLSAAKDEVYFIPVRYPPRYKEQ